MSGPSLSQSDDIGSTSAQSDRVILLAIAAFALWSALATLATFTALRNPGLVNVVIAADREGELEPMLVHHDFEVALREGRFSLFVRR